MEVKTNVVQTDVAETWVRRQQDVKPPPRIKPVKEAETAVFRKEDQKETREKGRGTIQELNADAVKEVVEKTQAFLDDLNIRLDFEVYEETGDIVVRIFNRETEELVRQIPPEELLKLHQKISELRGVLFDKKA